MNHTKFRLTVSKNPSQLLNDAKSQLNRYSLETLADVMATSRSKLHEVITEPKEIQVICGLLERLCDPTGHLAQYLRQLPSFEHPSLMHDSLGVSRLRNIVAKKSGITFVESDDELARTFVAYALGHEFQKLNPKKNAAFGISTFGDDLLVPFASVLTLQGTSPHIRHEMLVKHLSRARLAIGRPVILMDVVREFPAAVAATANEHANRHVIISDAVFHLRKIALPKGCIADRVRITSESAHCLTIQVISQHVDLPPEHCTNPV